MIGSSTKKAKTEQSKKSGQKTWIEGIMPTTLTAAAPVEQEQDFAQDLFIPSVYNKTYYSSVMQDEAALIKWQAGPLDKILKKHLSSLGLKQFPLMFDAGSGPAVHHLFALSKYTKKIHLADFMPENLAEIQKWMKKDPTAHDWEAFVVSILEQEGLKPTKRLIKSREREVRRKVIEYSHLDLKKPIHVLENSALLVSSFFVADSATKSKKVFSRMTRNAFKIVRPGGVLVAAYLGGCTRYRVGRKWINSANVTEQDIRQVFAEAGAGRVTVRRFNTPKMTYDGFDHIFAVVAEK